MLSPGSASALVNAALQWMQPQVIHALTSSLPGPEADPKQGNGREGRAAAATAPGPLCSALAAMMQFLRAHVQARQVELHRMLTVITVNAFQLMTSCVSADVVFPRAASLAHLCLPIVGTAQA